ncbi:MAG TPA: PhzF family phenazine biosynthesis protein, partial [Cellvibrionaceae bacterium]
MKLAITIVNAFAKGAFTGNPAAVIVTPEPLAENLMQQIAAQNNLAETAFVVTGCEPYSLRWFTPVKEVDLCGHATLAAAKVLFDQGYPQDQLLFSSLSGELGVRKINSALELDFPARPAGLDADADKESIANAIGCKASDIKECLIANWRVVVVEREETIVQLQPDFAAISALHPFAVMVTATGTDCDFVARFFAPNAGI